MAKLIMDYKKDDIFKIIDNNHNPYGVDDFFERKVRQSSKNPKLLTKTYV